MSTNNHGEISNEERLRRSRSEWARKRAMRRWTNRGVTPPPPLICNGEGSSWSSSRGRTRRAREEEPAVEWEGEGKAAAEEVAEESDYPRTTKEKARTFEKLRRRLKLAAEEEKKREEEEARLAVRLVEEKLAQEARKRKVAARHREVITADSDDE